MTAKNRVKVTVSFTVQREKFPGMFYDPQDFATAVVGMVKNQIGGYKPSDFETEVVPQEEAEAEAVWMRSARPGTGRKMRR